MLDVKTFPEQDTRRVLPFDLGITYSINPSGALNCLPIYKYPSPLTITIPGYASVHSLNSDTPSLSEVCSNLSNKNVTQSQALLFHMLNLTILNYIDEND